MIDFISLLTRFILSLQSRDTHNRTMMLILNITKGEILHWFGLFGAGSVSFGKSVVAWACGALGLWGILSIMIGASSRLDAKQSEKYGGQPAYEEWKGSVKSSVIPFIN